TIYEYFAGVLGEQTTTNAPAETLRTFCQRSFDLRVAHLAPTTNQHLRQWRRLRCRSLPPTNDGNTHPPLQVRHQTLVVLPTISRQHYFFVVAHGRPTCVLMIRIIAPRCPRGSLARQPYWGDAACRSKARDSSSSCNTLFRSCDCSRASQGLAGGSGLAVPVE